MNFNKLVITAIFLVGKRKILRHGDNPQVEEALMTWFIQQRNYHVPISSDLIKSKARYFHRKIVGHDNFSASNGWLQKFKSRSGIKCLKICGEQLSSDLSAVEPFKAKFLKTVKEMGLSADQIYNADESALFWRLLPTKTWVHPTETSAPGRKISKDRFTFMPCSNASGLHKLPLLVIGKSTKPRVFKNFELPVTYKATKKGWMSTLVFEDWFKNVFIKKVKEFLTTAGKPLKALLVLDNAPSHPKEKEINTDPNFRVLFLPPNCTAILQPMDQNLIQNIKVRYRKYLLSHILKENDANIGSVLKSFNLRNAVSYLNIAWLDVTKNNINKSWSKLMPEICSGRGWEDEDDIPLSQLREKDSTCQDINSIHTTITTLNPSANLSSSEIDQWARGENEYAHDFSEEDIIQSVLLNQNVEENMDSDSSIDQIEEVEDKVSNKEAVELFGRAISWAEQTNATEKEILFLKEFKRKAEKLHKDKCIQPKINSYFMH